MLWRCSSVILCFKFADSVVCLIYDIVGDRDEEKSFACRAPLLAEWRVRSRRRVAQVFGCRFTKVKLVRMPRDQVTSSTLSDTQRHFGINVTWRVSKNPELSANLLYAIFKREDTRKIKCLKRNRRTQLPSAVLLFNFVTLSCHRIWTKLHWYQYELISIC